MLNALTDVAGLHSQVEVFARKKICSKDATLKRRFKSLHEEYHD